MHFTVTPGVVVPIHREGGSGDQKMHSHLPAWSHLLLFSVDKNRRSKRKQINNEEIHFFFCSDPQELLTFEYLFTSAVACPSPPGRRSLPQARPVSTARRAPPFRASATADAPTSDTKRGNNTVRCLGDKPQKAVSPSALPQGLQNGSAVFQSNKKKRIWVLACHDCDKVGINAGPKKY